MAIHHASKYADVASARKQAGRGAPSPSPSVFIPKIGKDLPMDQWFWRELKEGGMLQQYMAREMDSRATRERWRSVAQRHHGFEQNNKSDIRKVASIPLRDYMRWKAVDPHFWDDDKNLRKLKSDNPDCHMQIEV